MAQSAHNPIVKESTAEVARAPGLEPVRKTPLNSRGRERAGTVAALSFTGSLASCNWLCFPICSLSHERSLLRMNDTFENALAGRVEAMLDACTRCGRGVEVCPVTGPGGVTAEPRAVIDGVIDILRHREGSPAARKWADACVLTGECI